MQEIVHIQVNWDYIYEHLGEWLRNPNIVYPVLFAMHYFIAWIVIVFVLQVKCPDYGDGTPSNRSDNVFARLGLWAVSPILVIVLIALGLASILFGYKVGTGKSKETNNVLK